MHNEKIPLPSKLIMAFGLGIVISASFMLQLRSLVVRTFGDETLVILYVLLCLLTITMYVLRLTRKKMRLSGIVLSVLIFWLAFLLMACQLYFAEKLHVLEFGLLGYLTLRDMFKATSQVSKNIVVAGLFVIAIGLSDEGFQRILPYRVFEFRDIATNIVSGFLGLILYMIYRRTTAGT